MIILKHDHECNKIGLGTCQHFGVRRKEVGRGWHSRGDNRLGHCCIRWWERGRMSWRQAGCWLHLELQRSWGWLWFKTCLKHWHRGVVEHPPAWSCWGPHSPHTHWPGRPVTAFQQQRGAAVPTALFQWCKGRGGHCSSKYSSFTEQKRTERRREDAVGAAQPPVSGWQWTKAPTPPAGAGSWLCLWAQRTGGSAGSRFERAAPEQAIHTAPKVFSLPF